VNVEKCILFRTKRRRKQIGRLTVTIAMSGTSWDSADGNANTVQEKKIRSKDRMDDEKRIVKGSRKIWRFGLALYVCCVWRKDDEGDSVGGALKRSGYYARTSEECETVVCTIHTSSC
jgi:hypothetical protein